MMQHQPTGAGKSSFDLIDEKVLRRHLALENGETLLDAACGPGHYTLFLAGIRGPGARIVAADLWREGIERLSRQIRESGIAGVSVLQADIGRGIGLATASVDVCLAATVIHDFVEDGSDRGALQEFVRILKPDGRLAAVEFKKIEGPPGPPAAIRLSEHELAGRLSEFGFLPEVTEDAGPFLYLSVFRRRKSK